jgi:hypothetical protein
LKERRSEGGKRGKDTREGNEGEKRGRDAREGSEGRKRRKEARHMFKAFWHLCVSVRRKEGRKRGSD